MLTRDKITEIYCIADDFCSDRLLAEAKDLVEREIDEGFLLSAQ